ncbi:hypothetical protein PATA110616_14820 [Paenibacillus tarimensis]
MVLLLFGVTLAATSTSPVNIYRNEQKIESALSSRYSINNVTPHDDRFELFSHRIDIVETETTSGMSSVQVLVNSRALFDPMNLKLEERSDFRYYSFLGFGEVWDRETDIKRAFIVQRLPLPNEHDTGERADYDKRQWYIYYLGPDGSVEKREYINMQNRREKEHHLGIRLIMSSGTFLIAMGYVTDVRHSLPVLIHPDTALNIAVIAGILMVVFGGYRLIRPKQKTAG